MELLDDPVSFSVPVPCPPRVREAALPEALLDLVPAVDESADPELRPGARHLSATCAASASAAFLIRSSACAAVGRWRVGCQAVRQDGANRLARGPLLPAPRHLARQAGRQASSRQRKR